MKKTYSVIELSKEISNLAVAAKGETYTALYIEIGSHDGGNTYTYVFKCYSPKTVFTEAKTPELLLEKLREKMYPAPSEEIIDVLVELPFEEKVIEELPSVPFTQQEIDDLPF